MHSVFVSVLRLPLALLALALLLAVVTPATTRAQSDPGTSVSTDAATKPADRLTAIRLQLDQTDVGLRRENLGEPQLQSLRQGLDPLKAQLEAITRDEQPKADALKAQLESLGKKPDDKAPPEAPAVARERAEIEGKLRESEELLRVASANAVRISQIETTIIDRRRALFARSLLERSASPVSPWLWGQVASGLPRDLAAMRTIFGDWLTTLRERFSDGHALLVIFGAVLTLLFFGPIRIIISRVDFRDFAQVQNIGLRRTLGAAIAIVFGTLVPAAVAALIYLVLDGAALLPVRVGPVLVAILFGAVTVSALNALSRALLAPRHSAWRIVEISDANAVALARMAAIASLVFVSGKIVETVYQAIGSGLPVTVLTRAIFTLSFAALIARAGQAIREQADCEDDSLGPSVPKVGSLMTSVRVVGLAALGIAALATIIGYVALGAFIVDQIVWVLVVGAVTFLLLHIIDDTLEAVTSGTGALSRSLTQGIGLRRRAVEQAAVIASGVLKVIALVIAGLLIAAPWGVESGDLLASLRAAIFGFKIGDVTISLSSLVIAAAFFTATILATRTLQRWLETRLLPHTELDSGLKNSIKTGIGYLGVLVALAFGVSAIGLSLDKITIVAGALSVGIGFGLQSIVANFVSGLILLWERSIKVGDLIVVGADSGVVRRIHVRSTELETGDRASVIIPNSNLVSGVVKNRVHNDRSGRVLIAIGVPRSADPDVVINLLTSAATAHPKVMKDPAPRAFFKTINELTLDFELVAFVEEVNDGGGVNSDLNLAIHKSLVVHGLERAVPRPALDIGELERVAGLLGRLRLEEADNPPKPPAAVPDPLAMLKG